MTVKQRKESQPGLLNREVSDPTPVRDEFVERGIRPRVDDLMRHIVAFSLAGAGIEAVAGTPPPVR